MKSDSFKSYVGHLHEISWILLLQQPSFFITYLLCLAQFTIYHSYILVNITLPLNSFRVHYFTKRYPTKIWDHIWKVGVALGYFWAKCKNRLGVLLTYSPQPTMYQFVYKICLLNKIWNTTSPYSCNAYDVLDRPWKASKIEQLLRRAHTPITVGLSLWHAHY
jgi:hypothetical protein